MFPVHANVAQQLADGEAPDRRVEHDNRSRPSGGRRVFLSRPSIDEAAFLGHASVAMTMRYADLSPSAPPTCSTRNNHGTQRQRQGSEILSI